MSDFLEQLKASTAGLDEVEDLLEGVQGGRILGQLTEELIHDYVTLVNLEVDLAWLRDTLVRRFIGRSVENITSVEGSMLNADLGHLLTLSNEHPFFESEEEAAYSFRMLSEYEYRTAAFWYKLRSQLLNGCWTRFLSIRKGWRIVDGGPKYR